jgi:NAD(P)H dehydrogenase (quinone)
MAGPGMMASKSWPHNWGDGREAMVWREDCVASAVAVLTGEGHEERVYNITGPDLQTCAELAELVSEITGVPIASVPLSDEEQYAMFDAMGIPRRPVDDLEVGGTGDVELLIGQPARSVRQMIVDNVEMLRGAGQ